jgi:hypothetical protein
LPVRRTIPFKDGIFFITFTCFHWTPLIELIQGYDIIYKWFDLLLVNQHYVCGYVIMPNHIHTLIGFSRTNQKINTIIGNGKRFMAYEILRRLEILNENKTLELLAKSVSSKERLRNKIHLVWEKSFDWKECDSEHLIMQKLNYMHENPCKGKWNLTLSPSEYVHSSARFYDMGEHSAYTVVHYQELEDIDLTNQP